MKNYQQRGHVIEVLAAAAAVAAGQPVAIGAILAVANGPAQVGEPYNAERVGVFVLPKAAGTAWTQGQPCAGMSKPAHSQLEARPRPAT